MKKKKKGSIVRHCEERKYYRESRPRGSLSMYCARDDAGAVHLSHGKNVFALDFIRPGISPDRFLSLSLYLFLHVHQAPEFRRRQESA